MDQVGIIVGIIAGIAASVLLGRRPAAAGASLGSRVGRLAVIVLAAAVAGGVTSGAMHYFRATSSGIPADRAVKELLATPLLRLVATEHPEIQVRMREAIEAELKSPTKTGPKRPFLLGQKIRQQYINPVLMRADDRSALAAIRKSYDLAAHLQKTNVALCRDFGVTGMQQWDKLDRIGQDIYQQMLSAQEDAYKNGKTGAAKPAPPDEEIGKALTEAGYSPAEIEKLAKIETLPAAEACAATVRLYGAPANLPVPRGALLARALLTVDS